MNRPTSTIALSLLLLSLPLLAQPRPAARQGGTVSGVVTTVSGSLITILEGWVTIDATDAVFTSRGSEASIADVKPGVRINAVLKSLESAGAALQASRVVILDPPDGTLSERSRPSMWPPGPSPCSA